MTRFSVVQNFGTVTFLRWCQKRYRDPWYQASVPWKRDMGERVEAHLGKPNAEKGAPEPVRHALSHSFNP